MVETLTKLVGDNKRKKERKERKKEREKKKRNGMKRSYQKPLLQ
ncbi:MAG: hypothetical protein ACTSWW_03770 [Promethearchaeota archaeon]